MTLRNEVLNKLNSLTYSIDELSRHSVDFIKICDLALEGLLDLDIAEEAEFYLFNDKTTKAAPLKKSKNNTGSRLAKEITFKIPFHEIPLAEHKILDSIEIYYLKTQDSLIDTFLGSTKKPDKEIVFIPLSMKNHPVGLVILSAPNINILIDESILTCLSNVCNKLKDIYMITRIIEDTHDKAYNPYTESGYLLKSLDFILRNPRFPIIYFNHKGAVTFFNEGSQALTGFYPEQIVSFVKINELFDNGVFISIDDLLKKDTRFPYSFSTRMLTHDGSYIHVEGYIYIIDRDEDENPEFITFIFDRSDKKALEMQQSFLKAAIDSSLDGMAFLDRFFNISSLNKAFADLFSMTESQLIGKNLFSLHEDKIQSNNKNEVLQSLKEDGRWRGIINVDKSENRPALFDIGIYEVYKGRRDDTVTGFIVISRDVTDIEEQKSKIRLLSSQITAFAELSKSAVSTVNLPIQFENFIKVTEEITEFNHVCIILFNKKEPYFEIYRSRGSNSHIKQIKEKAMTPSSFIEKVREGMAMGDNSFLLTSEFEPTSEITSENFIFTLFTDRNGKITGCICFSDYQMEKMPMNEEILALEVFASQISLLMEVHKLHEELAGKHKEMEEFVYTVSHDLKSPLMSVNGFTDILKKRMKDKLAEDDLHYFDRILANIHTINTMVQDLLELAKAGKIEKVSKNLTIKESVDKILSDLNNTREQKVDANYNLEFENINYDVKGLQVILSNLIGNAVKFTNKELKPILEIGSLYKQGEKVIYIKDRGTGIKPENLDTIFDPFVRFAENDVEGTGIGLAIVKKTVEARGGHVWVESTVGEGSTFFFTVSDNPEA